jgi:hypothetical protein
MVINEALAGDARPDPAIDRRELWRLDCLCRLLEMGKRRHG